MIDNHVELHAWRCSIMHCAEYIQQPTHAVGYFGRQDQHGILSAAQRTISWTVLCLHNQTYNPLCFVKTNLFYGFCSHNCSHTRTQPCCHVFLNRAIVKEDGADGWIFWYHVLISFHLYVFSLSRLNHLQNNNFVQVYVTKLCTFEKFGTGMGGWFAFIYVSFLMNMYLIAIPRR